MTHIYFDLFSEEQATIKALEKGKPLLVKVMRGKYRGSVASIAAKYINWNSEDIWFKSTSFILDFGKVKQRHKASSYLAQCLEGTSPNRKVCCKKSKEPIPLENVTDRHGMKLEVGDPVLIAQKRRFVFGVLEKLTRTALIVRYGTSRTRLNQYDLSAKGIVRLDKDLASRFMMEKLATL